MRPAWSWALTWVLACILAGCTLPGDETLGTDPPGAASPCPLPPVNLSGTVTEVHNASLLVDARGSLEGPVVLHVRDGETVLYLRDGLSCQVASLRDVHAGDPFEAVANGPVMESYPPQTVPSMVFIERKG